MDNVIKITLKKKEDYISKFNENIISAELSSYILEECRGYKLNDDIIIEIYSEYKMAAAEKEKLVDMIRSHFGIEVSESLSYQKRSIIIDFILFILGIIGFFIYFISKDSPIISEFIMILCWVVIWEAAYDLIFTKLRNKIDIERKRRLATCKINFKEKD